MLVVLLEKLSVSYSCRNFLRKFTRCQLQSHPQDPKRKSGFGKDH